ncbi:MerR family transcriptional regulator [Roseivivax marinus]|uniref:MerR family transcriptional regulator n=1 Tax=Roseivivax marinus TaxID=1379903 RepID=UPI0027403071|nr:MerR family transcriptional regulator [Roseivivax marinus]
MAKSPDAFRTISEVAEWLDTPAHVLRFWESKFTQVKPVKRAGGRRYYRPSDMELLGGIKKLLHDDGMTIKGVQKMLAERGVRAVSAYSQPVDAETLEGTAAAPEPNETYDGDAVSAPEYAETGIEGAPPEMDANFAEVEQEPQEATILPFQSRDPEARPSTEDDAVEVHSAQAAPGTPAEATLPDEIAATGAHEEDDVSADAGQTPEDGPPDEAGARTDQDTETEAAAEGHDNGQQGELFPLEQGPVPDFLSMPLADRLSQPHRILHVPGAAPEATASTDEQDGPADEELLGGKDLATSDAATPEDAPEVSDGDPQEIGPDETEAPFALSEGPDADPATQEEAVPAPEPDVDTAQTDGMDAADPGLDEAPAEALAHDDPTHDPESDNAMPEPLVSDETGTGLSSPDASEDDDAPSEGERRGYGATEDATDAAAPEEATDAATSDETEETAEARAGVDAADEMEDGIDPTTDAAGYEEREEAASPVPSDTEDHAPGEDPAATPAAAAIAATLADEVEDTEPAPGILSRVAALHRIDPDTAARIRPLVAQLRDRLEA